MIRHPFQTPPPEGAAVEVAEGVLWLRLPLPMALDHVNVYALDDGDGWTIVDTGFASRKSRAIWESVLAGPLRGKPVRRVVVTHHHPDHIGLAGWFQARGAELVTTRTAWLYARMLVLDEQVVPSVQALDWQRRAGVPQAVLAQRATERPFNFCDVVEALPAGFTRICEGDTLVAGGRRWSVRCGDGHAPEHATLWCEADEPADGPANGPAAGRLVIGGDQLLPGISANIGVYPTEPDADPLTEWLDSCRRFQAVARDGDLILPGHKLPFTGLPFRLVQMIENHEAALLRLLDHLGSPKVAFECFVPLFKREIGGAEQGLALVEAVAHLNCLRARGLVSRRLSGQGAWLWQKRDGL